MKKYIFIFATAFVFILLGHFFVINYQSIITPFAFAIIVFFIFKNFKDYDSFWSLLLVLFICNHFFLGENRGGIYSYVIIIFGILYFFKYKDFGRLNDGFLINLMLVTIIVNVILGYFYTEFNYPDQISFGFLILISSFVTFKVVSGIVITEDKIKDILIICGVTIVYICLVTINQRFSFIFIPFYTALLPPSNRSLTESGDIIQQPHDDILTLMSDFTRPLGTFMNWELTGQYALLLFLIFLPFYFYRKHLVKNYYLLIFSLSSLIVVINTLNRGPIIILPFAFLTGIIIISLFINKEKVFQKKILILPVLILLTIFFYPTLVMQTGIYTRLFEQEAFSGFVPNTRIHLWEEVIIRLKETPFTGLGIRTGPFMEQIMIGVAPHSLYLALPFYYGWIGGAVFVSFIIVTIVKLLNVFINSNVKPYLRYFSSGLFLFWISFLFDEYKIDMLRNAHFQHLVWFFLGLSWAVIKTGKLNLENYSEEILQS